MARPIIQGGIYIKSLYLLLLLSMAHGVNRVVAIRKRPRRGERPGPLQVYASGEMARFDKSLASDLFRQV
jgi:hypothetical protein